MACVVPGARGRGKVLIDEGYKYHVNKKGLATIHWRCWRKTCRAKLTSNFFDVDSRNAVIEVIYRDEHNHETDDRVIEHGQFLNNARRQLSDDPTKPVKRLYDQQVAQEHRNAATRAGRCRSPPVPEFSFVRSQLSRARSKLLPQVPHDVDDVVIQGAWRKTWRGERFLLRQSNDWGIVMFATRRNIRVLVRCRQLYMDATFRTAPRPYEQMFSVFGDYNGRVVPLITALMTNRTVGDYRQVFQKIKRSVRRITGQQWEPESSVVDFEQALITALETETPHTRLEGCYFHFNQSLWRRIQEAGLAHGYRNDERLQRQLRKVMALGFLPTALVRNNFWLLRTARQTQRLIRRYPALMDFLAYVQNTYIQGNFGIPFWNVYDRNMDCRTNNKAEVFHRAWNNRVGVRHPNLWIYIRHLKDLQSLTESDITAMDRGGRPTRRSRRWQRLENRLIQLKSEYDRGDKSLDDYWNAVSHLVHHH